jgi:hypothetical protein
MGSSPSTFSVTKQIINESGFGLNGLNRGLTATIARNGVFNMIYFGFYHSVKGIIPEYKVGGRFFNENCLCFFCVASDFLLKLLFIMKLLAMVSG